MRSDSDYRAGPTPPTGGLTSVTLAEGGRISDERYQSAVMAGLVRSLLRHAGKALHIELLHRPTHA